MGNCLDCLCPGEIIKKEPHQYTFNRESHSPTYVPPPKIESYPDPITTIAAMYAMEPVCSFQHEECCHSGGCSND